jgi:Domain of unknown function (DUF4440)
MSEFEDTMIERIRAWMLATFEGDREGQAKFEHEDAVFTYPGGKRFTQAEHIAATGQAVDVREHDITWLRCQTYGDDLAVVWLEHTLRTDLTEDPFGDPSLVQQFRDGIAFTMTTTWRRFGDDWRVISGDAHVLDDGYVPRTERRQENILTYPENATS